MNEATNGVSRVVEYKGCAIDPVSTAGSWAPRWTREGKRYDRLPAFATRTKAIEQTKRIIHAQTWQRYLPIQRRSRHGAREYEKGIQ